MLIKQEDLDISKFTIEEVEGNENFKKTWFNYKGKLPIIEVELKMDIYERAFYFRELQKK